MRGLGLVPEDSKAAETIKEIDVAEQKRAKKLAPNPLLLEWVKDFWHKYIVTGFLMPLYSWNNRYSRTRERIKHFSDSILPYDMMGTGLLPP